MSRMEKQNHNERYSGKGAAGHGGKENGKNGER